MSSARRVRKRGLHAFTLCLVVLSAATAWAQAPTASALGSLEATSNIGNQPPPTPPDTGVHAFFSNLEHAVVALPSVQNLWIAGIGGAGALAAHAVDDTFNQRLQRTGDFFRAGNILGGSALQMGAALGTYVVGRWQDYPKAAHAGMDLLHAQIIAEGLTQGIKVSVRRERPAGTGFAFPSGHAAVTVATATVIQRHFGIVWSLPLYGTAAYVAMSRLHDNRHWLSDVVFGVAVGEVAGRTVTRRHGRSNYTVVPVYTPGEMALLIMRTAEE